MTTDDRHLPRHGALHDRGPRVERATAGRRRPGTVALALVLSVAAQAGQAKRLPPADVPPVVVGEIRYEVPRMGTPFGYAEDGGLVVARRVDSGELVWTRRIYVVVRDPRKEGDVQDVFIKELKLAPDGRHLRVLNERGRRFELDLDGGAVREIP